MDKSKVILRLKKTIIYVEKTLDNFPKKDIVLKNKILDSFYNILEDTFKVYISNDKLIIKNILIKIRMLDFYLQISLDKEIISRKNIKNISLNLRDITNIYYAWLNSNNEKV